MSEKYPLRKKHDFFNSIYNTFHSNYNPETRIYTKHCENFDFTFKDDKLYHIEGDRADVEGAKKFFPTLKDTDINPNLRSVQNKISYYLTNRIVPGFNASTMDVYKKENAIMKKETTLSQNYLVDKWYFQKQDKTKKFYEKYFYEKEIDKLRIKNQKEKNEEQKKDVK